MYPFPHVRRATLVSVILNMGGLNTLTPIVRHATVGLLSVPSHPHSDRLLSQVLDHIWERDHTQGPPMCFDLQRQLSTLLRFSRRLPPCHSLLHRY